MDERFEPHVVGQCSSRNLPPQGRTPTNASGTGVALKYRNLICRASDFEPGTYASGAVSLTTTLRWTIRVIGAHKLFRRTKEETDYTRRM